MNQPGRSAATLPALGRVEPGIMIYFFLICTLKGWCGISSLSTLSAVPVLPRKSTCLLIESISPCTFRQSASYVALSVPGLEGQGMKSRRPKAGCGTLSLIPNPQFSIPSCYTGFSPPPAHFPNSMNFSTEGSS